MLFVSVDQNVLINVIVWRQMGDVQRRFAGSQAAGFSLTAVVRLRSRLRHAFKNDF